MGFTTAPDPEHHLLANFLFRSRENESQVTTTEYFQSFKKMSHATSKWFVPKTHKRWSSTGEVLNQKMGRFFFKQGRWVFILELAVI